MLLYENKYIPLHTNRMLIIYEKIILQHKRSHPLHLCHTAVTAVCPLAVGFRQENKMTS